MFAFFEKRKPETAETIPGLSLQDTVKYAVDAFDDVIVYLDKNIKFVLKKGILLTTQSMAGKSKQ